MDPNNPAEEFYDLDPDNNSQFFAEDEAVAVLAFGSMYRDSRKELQAARTGRDQKVVVKSKKFKQFLTLHKRKCRSAKHYLHQKVLAMEYKDET